MTEGAPRTLIAGVGYRLLQDHSVGGAVADRLGAEPWPDHVSVEDLSYGPVAVAQRLQDETPATAFRRCLAVAAVARGRPGGTVTAYRWDRVLPPPERVQEAVTEAVTGVIALENTLLVARHLEALPPEVIVVEVEPLLEAFGEGFSPPVADAVEQVCTLVRALVEEPARIAALPVTALGGGMIGASGP